MILLPLVVIPSGARDFGATNIEIPPQCGYAAGSE